METLPDGTFIASNGHRYGTCSYCQRVLRLDSFLGGIHICLDESERNRIDIQRAEFEAQRRGQLAVIARNERETAAESGHAATEKPATPR